MQLFLSLQSPAMVQEGMKALPDTARFLHAKRLRSKERLIFPLQMAETEKEFKTTEKAKKEGQRGWENAHVHMVKTCRGFTPMLFNSDLRISPSKTECLRCCCCGRCRGTCFVGSISTTVERIAIACTEV